MCFYLWKQTRNKIEIFDEKWKSRNVALAIKWNNMKYTKITESKTEINKKKKQY